MTTTMRDQKARLLAALKHGPVTADMARHTLAVRNPAQRVRELRNDGHRIATIMDFESARPGRLTVYLLQDCEVSHANEVPEMPPMPAAIHAA